MTQHTAKQTTTPDEIQMQQEQSKQDERRVVQEGQTDEGKAMQSGLAISFPTWPTSKPGPQSTPPPPGMKPISAIRREQVAEMNYNQETGEPADQNPLRANPDETLTGPTGFDQPLTGQEMLRKRKPRL
jgi:hypothetical protein